MKLNPANAALANELRAVIHARTKLIDDGEAVAMVLLWSFLLDHARCMDMDVEQLATEQMQAFIAWARENMKLEKAQ